MLTIPAITTFSFITYTSSSSTQTSLFEYRVMYTLSVSLRCSLINQDFITICTFTSKRHQTTISYQVNVAT